jgi:hypothetical protein
MNLSFNKLKYEKMFGQPDFTGSSQPCIGFSTGNNLSGDGRFLTIIVLLVRILSQISLA